MPASTSAAASSAPPPSSRAELFESITELKGAFLQAVAFCRPLLSSDATTAAPATAAAGAAFALSDADKLSFYAYFRQATHGDCPLPAGDDDVSMMGPLPEAPDAASAAAQLTIARAKRDAWRKCLGMRRRDAMRAFVLLLDKSAPGWEARK